MPDNNSILAVAAASLLSLSAPAPGQWLDYRTPPTPRMANGKPDLSGLWRTDNTGDVALGKAMDALKPQAWVAATAKT